MDFERSLFSKMFNSEIIEIPLTHARGLAIALI